MSERLGRSVVHAVSPAGGEARVVALVPGDGYPGPPDPRGTHALLISAEDEPGLGHRERLWLAPLHGGDAIPLTEPARWTRHPSWAPDGSWIVFESDAESFRDLYRVDRDGGAPVRLTDAPHGSFEPAVAPDGRRIAFGTSRDGNAEVYVMNADGSNPVRRTNDVGDEVQPGWVPGTGSLCWIAHREGIPRLVISPADGGASRPLRKHGGERLDLDYSWSPDGSRVAVVVQTASSTVEIEIVDGITGMTVGRLGGDGIDEHPTWSPDGLWIAWTRTREGRSGLSVAAADGSGARSMPTASGADWLPRWVGFRPPS